MFTLLIVEDEDVIREGLVHAIPWNQYGYRVAGSARNGEEGLALFKTLRPDVVMTDIKMPDMDGLEMLAAVRELDRDVQVVLLSGYEEFEFAKKGMQYGAFAYMLKLTLFDEIAPVYRRLHEKLTERRKNEKKITELTNLKTSRDFQKVLQGDSGAGMALRGKNCAVMVLWCPENDQREQLMNGLANATEVGNSQRLIANQDEAHIVLAYAFDSDPAIMERFLTDQAEKLGKRLEDGCCEDYFIGVGGYKTQAELAVSYQEAMKMVDYGRYHVTKGIYVYSKIKTSFARNRVSIDGRLLANWIDLNKQDKLQELLADLYAQMLENDGYFFPDLRGIYNEVLLRLNTYVKTLQANHDGLENVDQLIRHLNQMDSMLEMKDWIVPKIAKIYSQIEDCQKEASFENLQRVTEYVARNYRSDIKMQEMAELVYMSPPYFSVRFKEVMGLNFTDYLKQIRLQKAVELLTATNKKVFEIAAAVGYEDEKYFCRVFKSVMRMSPHQYREKQRADMLS